MGEQKKEKTKSAASAVVATAIAAAAAIAAIVVLIFVLNKPKETPKLPDGTEVTFKPTQEFADECGEKARELVANNYKIVRLFISEGLPRLDEPYGNRPEDGLYTVNSDKYGSYEEIESLVKSIYTEKEAQRILTQMPADPAAVFGAAESSETSDAASPELIAVYGTREIYVGVPEEPSDVSESQSSEGDIPTEDNEDNGGEAESSSTPSPQYVKKNALGINELFKPYTAYSKPWGSISIRVLPTSEEECGITVYLGADKDVNLSSVDEPDILNTKMIKENGVWHLENLIY